MCVCFFYDFIGSFIIFKKFVHACHFFLSNLDFVESLGVFAVIYPFERVFGFWYVDLNVWELSPKILL